MNKQYWYVWLGAVGVAIILLLGLLGTRANAQPMVPCGDRNAILESLRKGHDEYPFIVALDASGRLMEIIADPISRSWTMLVTSPGGRTCLVGSGENLEVVDYAGPTDDGV